MQDFLLESYRYPLDEKRIALMPASPSESAKMFVYSRDSGQRWHESFGDLPGHIGENDVLFLNDSKVLPARIVTDRCTIVRPSGKTDIRTVELLYLRSTDDKTFETMVYPGDYFPVWSKVTIGDYSFVVKAITYEGRTFELVHGKSIMDFLLEFGKLPLPPYIGHSDDREKAYQTEFAKKDGSLAAPTASLHFTLSLLGKLKNAGVSLEFATLHVGIGTFKIMNAPDIRDHEMHEEYFEISPDLFERIARYRLQGKRIIAVGTTMVRTLESLSGLWPAIRERREFSQESREYWDRLDQTKPVRFIGLSDGTIRAATSLFIMPGYEFGMVEWIVTNFHLPESTLLVMMSAFLGRETLFDLYEEAMLRDYRFYSFGDGMLLI